MRELTPVATATSTGDWYSVPDPISKARQETFTFTVDITGAPSAVSIDIEGAIGDSTAFVMATHAMTGGELTATVAGFHIAGKPVDKLRYNITITGGTNPTATVRVI